MKANILHAAVEMKHSRSTARACSPVAVMFPTLVQAETRRLKEVFFFWGGRKREEENKRKTFVSAPVSLLDVHKTCQLLEEVSVRRLDPSWCECVCVREDWLGCAVHSPQEKCTLRAAA